MKKSLINIDTSGLQSPFKKLVKAISRGCGLIYEPIHTVRTAQAEADVKKIEAKSKYELLELEKRANARMIIQEARRQKNIESIAEKTVNELPDEVSEKSVDGDWLTQFFNHAQDVSDDDMQKIWAKILSGELSKPGSFSKRTLIFLQTLEKGEAIAFAKLCSLTVKDSANQRLLFDEVFIRGLSNALLGSGDYIDHFISIGLISSKDYEIDVTKLDNAEIHYLDKAYKFESAKNETTPHLSLSLLSKSIHFRMLSSIGQELAGIAEADEHPHFIEKLTKNLRDEYKVGIRES